MIGKTLAHYEITDLLGKGGMGEVYRARDTKLGRDVAIKVLHSDTSSDPERVARFQREARTLATLQHTNVASIYGFEDTGDVRFLVMELVEGEDLGQRLVRGAVPLDEAIAIARQIAAGLEAAHDQGIVHRDLKPANVKIAPDGHVKILDFGLARAYLGDPSDTSDPMHSPTITAGMTQAGVILGTAAYMSPEQARGKPVDRRADIWAFGVLVHEMLSGDRLFAGETVSDTLAGVLKTDIDLSHLPRDCPAALRRLLVRCLDRESVTRLRDIGEARILLDGPLDADDPVKIARRGGRGRFLGIGALVGLALGAALIWTLAPSGDDARSAREVRFSIPGNTQEAARSALSPDGTRFLYSNEGRLWIREFDSLEPLPIPGTEGAMVCNWSPDSAWIVFSLQTEIYKIRPDGSDRTRLCEIATDMHPWAGSVDWTEDGRIVFATGDAGLFSVGEAGGDPKVLLAPEEDETDFHHVFVLPQDRGFLFHPHQNLTFDAIHLYTGTERRELLRVEGQQLNSAVYGAGHIYFMRSPDNAGIWAVPFSLESLEITGEPFLVATDGNFPSVSRRGDLAFVPESMIKRQIVRIDSDGLVTRVIGDYIQGVQELAVSPDGREAVVLVEDKHQEIWIVDMATGDRQRLFFSKDRIENLSWAPDGNSLIYSAGLDADMHLEIRTRDGSATSAIGVRGQDPTLLRDDRTVVMTVWNEANEQDVGLVDITDPDLDPVLLASSPVAEHSPVPSPDESLVAYVSLESGRREVIVQSFPDGKNKWEISREGGIRPFWSATGDHLYFSTLSNGWIYVVDVSRDPVRFSTPRRLFGMSNIRHVVAVEDGGFAGLQWSLGEQQGSYEVWLNGAARLAN